jgi:hypothetical protein
MSLTKKQALEADFPREFTVPSLEGFAYLTARVRNSE